MKKDLPSHILRLLISPAYTRRETGGKSETSEGSNFWVLSFRKLEPRTPSRAFLAYLALHAPRSVVLTDFFSILRVLRVEQEETEKILSLLSVRFC